MHRAMLCALIGFVFLVPALAAAPEKAAPAHADEKTPHLEARKTADGAPASKDPHADPHAKKDESLLAFSADLGIWTVVVFVLLLVILRFLAWKPMLEGLQKREEGIRSALDEAAKAKTEAQRLQAYLDEQKAKMGEEVRQAIEEARKDAQRLKEEMTAQARTEIQTERDRLYREMGIAKDQAVQELWHQAANLATLISAKTLKRSISPDDHRKLVDEAIGELQAAGGRQRNLIVR